MEFKRILSSLVSGKYCLLFIFLLSTVVCEEDNEEDTSCKLRRVLIRTTEPEDYYDKPVIWVNKCSGNTSPGSLSAKDRGCVATKWKDSSVVIKGKLNGVKTFNYTDHLECDMKCICSADNKPCGDIGPDNKKNYLIECPQGSSWVWDRFLCECKGPSQQKAPVGCSTNEENEVSISITMFVVALLIEFFIVIVVIFVVMDACKYRHDMGILHKTAEYIRNLSSGRRDDQVTLKKDRNGTGSESFLNGYCTSTGKINHV